ncbi:MAG: hypothetical protein RI897_3974 [Verrucomicrobiota bacterium]
MEERVAVEEDIEGFEQEEHGAPDQRVTGLGPEEGCGEHESADGEEGNGERAGGGDAGAVAEAMHPGCGADEFSGAEDGGHNGGEGDGAEDEVSEGAEDLGTGVFPVSGAEVNEFEEPPGGSRGEEEPGEAGSGSGEDGGAGAGGGEGIDHEGVTKPEGKEEKGGRAEVGRQEPVERPEGEGEGEADFEVRDGVGGVAAKHGTRRLAEG